MKIGDKGYLHTFGSNGGGFDNVPVEVIDNWYFKWTAKDGTIQEAPCEDLGDSLFTPEKITRAEAMQRWSDLADKDTADRNCEVATHAPLYPCN